MNIKPGSAVLLVCHDAGGAEILSAYVKKNKDHYVFSCFVSGPAVNIFQKKGLNYLCLPTETSLEACFSDSKLTYDMVLTGTSWTTDLERRAIIMARNKGIRTASYLDHWVNYKERFGYPALEWKTRMPDEIWVGDKYAYAQAKKDNFPLLRLVPNQYFEEMREEIKRYRLNMRAEHGPGNRRQTILFISEPVSLGAERMFGDPGHWGYTESDVFDILCRAVSASIPKRERRIVVRLHPADNPESYHSLISLWKPSFSIEYSDEPNIVAEVLCSDIIVGMESMALVVAVLADKPVLSCVPSAKKSCSLPFEEIIHVSNENALRLALDTPGF